MPGLLFSSLPATCWLPSDHFSLGMCRQVSEGTEHMKAAQVTPWEAPE